jgi:hypothetical protein
MKNSVFQEPHLVNFEQAIILKNIGFDETTDYQYQDSVLRSHFGVGPKLEKMIHQNFHPEMDFSNDAWKIYAAPRIYEFVDWVYRKFGVWLAVEFAEDSPVCGFYYSLSFNDWVIDKYEDEAENATPLEAYKRGVDHVLYFIQSLPSNEL